jgi:hypothetical protein
MTVAIGAQRPFGRYGFEYLVACLGQARGEIGPASDSAQTAVDFRQRAGTEELHHPARLSLDFRQFLRKPAGLILVSQEARVDLLPAIECRRRDGLDAGRGHRRGAGYRDVLAPDA